MKKKQIYFKNLDSIRFIAAFMVFLSHSLLNSYHYLPIKNYPCILKALQVISNGGTGVSIFFVLSGFLITFLLMNEHEINNKISLENFYLRRILRIWPLYFLIITLTFFIYPSLKSLVGNSPQLPYNIVYHLTFLSNFDVINIEKNFQGFEVMSQNITWSVSIEEQFYLIWPLIFLTPKKIWIYLITLIIICSIGFRLKNWNENIILYFHTFSVLIDLSIGGIMAWLVKSNSRIKVFFENSSTSTHIILFLSSLALLYFNDIIFSFKYGNAINRVFTSISFALIISAQALTKSKSSLNLYNLTFANKWGKYTYGIYLLHPIILTILGAITKTLGIFKTNFTYSLLICILAFVFTLILSRISYEYYELKFISLKKKYTTT